MTRRDFLAGSAGLAAAVAFAARGAKKPSAIPGRIVGASAAAGHRLRSGNFPEPSEEIATEAVVIGGGIAGLAAARQLRKKGVGDLLLLELEDELGGNSRSGRNAISAFPWGAHYLPLPSEESTEVTELLEELGLITGRAADGLPIFDEYALCADPMERLFINGEWQEGLIPRLDVPANEAKQIDSFLDRMEHFRTLRGSDGKRAFAIPVDRSSRDPDLLALDRLTMADYLRREGWTAKNLLWYVDYCCRDDYGAGSERVSAWAGVHYFASRNGRAANAGPGAVLTWPEGNGWLANRLRQPIANSTRTRSLVWRIQPSEEGVVVDYVDLARERSVRVRARGAVCALPRFIANRLIHAPDWKAPTLSMEYSPWMVANLTLEKIPGAPEGPPAWDNVIQGSRSLGYVNATHQSLESHPQSTVLTYYQPLDTGSPAEAREKALPRSHADWAEEILSNLAPAHPDLRASLLNLDVWLWGHAMIRPIPNFIWGAERATLASSLGRLAFAHSDQSGLSIFEEAFTRGVTAADVVFRQLRSIA
jgi:putative NAD(P)-binding protein